MVIAAAEGDRPAPLAAGADAEDGRAPTFLLRDAKPLAAAEKSRRPVVAGRRSGRSPHPRPQITPSRTRRAGRADSARRGHGDHARYETRVLRWHRAIASLPRFPRRFTPRRVVQR